MEGGKAYRDGIECCDGNDSHRCRDIRASQERQEVLWSIVARHVTGGEVRVIACTHPVSSSGVI
jgi:hypothetical protein